MAGETERRTHEAAIDAAPGKPSESALALVLYLLRIFTTRIWLFLVVFSLIFTIILVNSMRGTKIYRATAEILIERQSSNLKNLESPLTVNTDDSDYYNTQVRILEGRGLAQIVAAALSLDQRDDFSDRPADDLLGGLQIDFVRNARVVEIAYEHADKQLAAKIVNAYIVEYKKDTLKRRSDTIDELQAQMRGQLDDVETKLRESQKLLLDFYEKNGLLLGDERESSLQRMMEEAGLMLLREQQELNRLEGASEKVDAAGTDVNKLYQIALAHYLFWREDSQQLEETRALSGLAEMQKKYQPTHPSYLGALARVQEIQRRVAESALTFARSVVVLRDNKRESVKAAQVMYEDLKKRRLEQDRTVGEAERLRRTRDAYQTLFEALTLRIKEAAISNRLDTTNVHTLIAAAPPITHIRPNLTTNLLLGLVGALMAGIAITLMVDRLDNTVRTTQDVEESYGLPVLSVVPQARIDDLSGPPALACWKDEMSQMAEAFRRVRAAVLLSVKKGEGGPLRRMLVLSPGPDEGKSTAAMNLAISLAQMGERTLLIDADFYRSESHKLLGLDREKGLSTILVSDIALPQAVQTTGIPCLDYMATGMIPPQPATLLGSARMRWLMEEATRHYSRVVIDTPPLVAVTDATLLAPLADATILVVREGKTSKTALHRSLQTLARTGVRPMGFIFNGLRTGMGEFYFRYHNPTYSLDQSQQASPPVGTTSQQR